MPNIGYSVDTVAFLQDTVNTPAGANLNVDQSLLVGSDFNVDSGKFFVDQSTGNIGIGTTTPSTLLDIYGEGADTTQVTLRQWNDNSSNVIDGPDIRFIASGGTIASPAEMDTGDVIGKVNAFAYNGTNSSQYGGFGWKYYNDGVGGRGSSFAIETKSTNESSNSAKIFISGVGAVGIGTATPIAVNLQVNGFYNSGTSEYGAPTQYFLTTLSSPSAGDNIGRIIFARNGDSATIAAKSTGTADETDLYFYNRTSGGADNVNNIQNTTPTLKLYHDKTAEFAGDVTVVGNNIKLLGPTSGSTFTTSTLTLRGFRQSAGGEFGNVDFSNIDANSSNTEYLAARISAQIPDGADGGELNFFVTPHNSTTITSTPAFILHGDSSAEFASNLTVGGNLIVNGTTTTINSTTLTVDDKNIVLASGAANSAAADGAGITIDGANESLTWTDSNKSFIFSERLAIGSATSQSATLRLSNDMGGESLTTYYGILNNGYVQPDVTGSARYQYVQIRTAGNSGTGYTISNVEAYGASVGANFSADSTVTNLVGFDVKNSWIEGTNNYGFRGQIDTAANTNRWNVYMDGSAPNYFAGNIGIGTDSPETKLDVLLGTAGNTIRVQTGRNDLPYTTYRSDIGSFVHVGYNRTLNALAFSQGSNPEVNDPMMVINPTGEVGIGTGSPGSKLELGTSASHLQLQGIAVLNPHSLGLTNANYAYSDVDYNNTSSYLTAGFKSNAPDAKTGAFIASTGAGVDGLGGTVNAAIYHDGQGYFAGNVGIGTDSPGEALEVVAPGPTIKSRATGNDAAKLAMDSDRAAGVIGAQILSQWNGNTVSRIDFFNGADGTNKDDGEIRFLTSTSASNPQPRLSIDSNGNVGIGTTTPSTKLDVQGTVNIINAIGDPVLNLASNASYIRDISDGTDDGGHAILQMGSPDGSYVISTQDGTGRIQHRWNSSTGTSPTFLVGSENAGFWEMNSATPSTELFNIRHDSGSAAAAGDPIGWNTIFNVGLNEITWRGNPDTATTTAFNRWEVTNDQDTSTSSGASYMQLKGNDSDRSGWRLVAGDDATAGYFKIQDFSGSSWTTNLYISEAGRVGIGTESPGSILHITGAAGSTSRIHIQSTGSGATTFDGSGSGLLMTAAGMNTTSKFTPALQFGSTDGNFTTTNPKVLAAINGISTQTYDSDNAGGMDLAFYTTPNDSSTANAVEERVRIDRNGNVGIGTESPDTLLEISEPVSSTTPAKMKIVNEGDRGVTIGFLDHNASPDFAISNGDQTNHFLTIAGGGDIGINTTDPVEQLHVDSGNVIIGQASGATTNIRNYVKFGRTTGPKAAIGFINNDSNSRGDLLFMNSNVNDGAEFTDAEEVMRITKDGYVGIGATAPSSRLQIGEPTTANADNYILFGRRGSSQTETNTPFIGQSGGTYTTADLGLGARSTSGRIRFYTGNTTVFDPNNERMTIDASGNVGIGTSSPGALVEIAGTGSPAIRLKDLDGTNQFGQILANNGLLLLESRNDTSDGQIVFRGRDNVGTNEYGRFDENGNFGIGEANPTEKLHVEGGSIRVEHNAPFIKFAETGLTGSPVFWAGMDGGNFSIRLNNTSPYPFVVDTKGTNNDSIESIVFGGDTISDALRITAQGTNPTYLDLKGNNANARMRYYQGTTERWNIGYDTSVGAFTFYDAQNSSTRMFMYDIPNNGIVIGQADNGGLTYPSTDGGGATTGAAALRIDGGSHAALFCYNDQQSGDPVAIFAKGNEADDNQVVIIAGDGDGSEELLDIRSSTDPVNASDLLSFARDNANSVFRVYGDGAVYAKGNIASAPVFITTYGAGNLDITTEQTVVLDSTLATSGTSDFTVSAGGVITVLKTGTYQISYSITTDVTSGTGRSTSYAYLRINGVGEQTASRTYMYNREANNGENTSSKTMMFALTANDTIELRAARNSGTDTVVVLENYTTLALHRLT